ncbi:hypothetical protein FOZ61_000815 [Perkinsus olseni]|uniref:WD repeat-containing protein 17 n=1 Tax=Perkinsus olseni TaxID=32597 RepID=A0A7J6LYQ7_PEROL|nr:hypothetical protein FOZ61_000815 [Perkinsus olseni]
MDTLGTLPAGAQCWHKTVLSTSGNHLAYLSTLTLNVIRISDLTPVDTREITFGSVRDEMLAAVIRNPHGDDEFLVVSYTGRATLVRVEGGSLAPSPGAQEPFQLAMHAGSSRRTESVSEILLDFDAVEAGVLWYYHHAESGEHQLRHRKVRDHGSAPLERSFRLGPPSPGSRPLKSPAEGASRPTATVLRPHHSRRRTLAFGWSNGGVTMITVEVGERVLSAPRGTAVVDLAWDLLSTCYILAAYGNGEIVLLDTSGSGLAVESCRFDAATTPIRSVLWQCGSRGPGSFLTAGGNGSTVLQLWNVSKRAPVGEMKVHGSVGVNAACCLPGDGNRVLASFRDGAVVIIDVKARGVRKVSGSSMETVFDCSFHPRDPNVFCTGSYDGCVKLWRMLSNINGDVDSIAEVVAEMSASTESDGGQPAVAKSKSTVYGVDFSYCGQKIAGVTVKGELHVWRVDTGQFLSQVLCCARSHSDEIPISPSEVKSPVRFACVHAFRVSRQESCERSVILEPWVWHAGGSSWALATKESQIHARHYNVVDIPSLRRSAGGGSLAPRRSAMRGPHSGWIAFARTDGKALVVDQLQGGRTVAVLDHQSPVFGAAWTPFAEGSSPQLCTTDLDGVVRVWSISPTNGVARISHCLSGHKGKAFNVLPHPLLRGIIASGGDDSTAPFESGMFRRAAVSTSTVTTPLMCTSRDSTIKCSTTEWLCRLPIVCALFAEDPVAELASFISTDDRDAILREFLDCSPEAFPGKPVPYTSLYGPGSARLLEELRSRDRDPLRDAVDILSFFVYRRGVEDIADVVRGLLGIPRQHDGPGEYVPEEDIEAACSSRAYTALAAATTAPSVVGNLDARGHFSVMPESRPSLGRAAELFLVNGDIRNYCEALARGRQWEAAIAMAPAVSLQYWQELCDRYVDFIKLSESSDSTGGRDEALPYLIAAAEAIQLMVDRGGKCLEPMTLAKALADGRVPDRCVDLHIPRTPPGDRSHFERACVLVAESLARQPWTRLRACGILLGSGQTENAFALLGRPEDTLLHCGLRKMLHSCPSQRCALTEKLTRVTEELESVGRLPPLALIDFINDVNIPEESPRTLDPRRSSTIVVLRDEDLQSSGAGLSLSIPNWGTLDAQVILEDSPVDGNVNAMVLRTPIPDQFR